MLTPLWFEEPQNIFPILAEVNTDLQKYPKETINFGFSNLQGEDDVYSPIFKGTLPFLQNDHPLLPTTIVVIEIRCVKSVQIRNYFWYVLSPNTGKYRPEITPHLDTFQAVIVPPLWSLY